MTPTRVLLADDHVLFRQGVALILTLQPDFEVVGEADHGLAAVEQALQLRPDLVLMDLDMPECDGIEATRRIKRRLPGATVVMLAEKIDQAKILEATMAGAAGYLTKVITSAKLLELLRCHAQVSAAIDSPLLSYSLAEYQRLSPPRLATPRIPLSPREREVLTVLALGATDREIARDLHISIHTAKRHVSSILAKMGVSSRYAIRAAQVDEGLRATT